MTQTNQPPANPARFNFAILPEAGLAAVILTNADNGQSLLPAFRRRVIELLYDAERQAEDQVRGMAERVAAERAHWTTVVTMPVSLSKRSRLASEYRSAELGPLIVDPLGADLGCTLDSWQLAVGAREACDKSLSLVTMDPMLRGLTLAADTGAGGAIIDRLTLREAQHEYVYNKSVAS